MNKLWLALAASLIAGSASAEVFDFTFSDGTDSASGRLTTSSTAAPYAITGISGIYDGSAITGLSGYAAADNTLYEVTPLYFSLGGLSFTSVGGAYNIYAYNGGDYLLKSSDDPVGYPQNGTLLTTAVISVPEPATWALMLIGFGTAGLGLRASRRQSATA